MAPIEDKPAGADDEQEDTPAIKALKAIDEKYCEIQKEFEQAEAALRVSYFNERQAPLLTERARVLADLSLPGAEVEKEYGTPACVSFWLQAFQNCELADMVEEWDAPVLAYLSDIKKTYLDDKLPQKGFKLEFLFVENPFFFNSSLWVEFHTNYDPETYQPWKEPECHEMKCSDIGWKPSKNVTVELTAKQAKGGRKKGPQKNAKAKEEPRDSFFRFFFRNLKVGDEVPADISLDGVSPDELDEDDAKGLVAMVLSEQFFRLGSMVAEEIIPYAIRFYTGEAGGDGHEDDDNDDEDDEEEDDDDEDDDSDDEPPAKGKKSAKKKDTGAAPPAAKVGDKQEECKQQ